MDHGMIVLTSHFQGEEQVGKVRKDMAEMLPHHPTTPVRGWVVRNACSAELVEKGEVRTMVLDECVGIGMEFKLRGQAYTITGFEPREGKQLLVLLSSPCAECGVPFATKTPLRIKWLSRRCAEHAKPGVRVQRAKPWPAPTAAQ